VLCDGVLCWAVNCVLCGGVLCWAVNCVLCDGVLCFAVNCVMVCCVPLVSKCLHFGGMYCLLIRHLAVLVVEQE
jgi:hypothetical protein